MMFRNLCISGAGTKGPLLIGAMQAMDERGILDSVRDVAGISFGAILAFLWSMGWKPRELYDVTKNIHVNDLCKINIRNFTSQFGLSSTANIIAHIENLMKTKNISKNITLREHLYLTDKVLRIGAVCMNTRKLVYFTAYTHPNLYVTKAIEASIAIPLLYTSPTIDDHLYVDGGLLRHVPYDPYIGWESATLCLFNKIDDTAEYKIKDLQRFLYCLFDTLTHEGSQIPEKFEHCIEVNTTVGGVDFSIKCSDIEQMFNDGYAQSLISLDDMA